MSPSQPALAPPDGDNSAEQGAPAVCVLDVNETLSDMSPLADRLAAVGLDGQLEAWFAAVLRDGFALSLVQGAHSAGLRTAWIKRRPGEWPACFDHPDITATGIDDLATQLSLGSG